MLVTRAGPGKRRIPLCDVDVKDCLKGGGGGGGGRASPAQLGKTVRLKGSLWVGIWPITFAP